MSWRKHMSLFSDTTEKWLLVVGSHLGASSGVPLPFHSTPWSPSVRELVQYHIFRSQSRELAHSVRGGIETGKPPLGYLSDDLIKQEEWLQEYTNHLSPQLPYVRLADLAKSGMFAGIFSSCYDSLLEQSLSMLQVPYAKQSLENPNVPSGTVPLCKEYDDCVFQDQQERKSRESQFLKHRLKALLTEYRSILLVGQPPYANELTRALQDQIERYDDLKIVWVEEQSQEQTASLQTFLPASPPHRTLEKHPGWTPIQVDDLGEFLDEVASTREVVQTAIVQLDEEPEDMAALMNRSVDIRPFLLYVPGLGAFGTLINKLPMLSLRAVFSLTALALVIFGFLNYSVYSTYQKQLHRMEQSLRQAKQILSKKYDYSLLVQAQKTIHQGLHLGKKTRFLKPSPWVPGPLYTYLHEQNKTIQNRLHQLRSMRLLPERVRMQRSFAMEAHPWLQKLRLFPEVPVSLLTKRALNQKLRSIVSSRLGVRVQPTKIAKVKQPFSDYRSQKNLVLLSKDRMFLKVLLLKEIRQDLQKGQLGLVFDWREKGKRSLPSWIHSSLNKLAYPDGKCPGCFTLAHAKALLRQQTVTLGFMHIESDRNSRRALLQIREFQKQYPGLRILLTTTQSALFQQYGKVLPNFSWLRLHPLGEQQAKEFLTQRTSTSFVRGIVDNLLLREEITNPLVLSLCVSYYQSTGNPPKNLGVLYHFLLRLLLQKGKGAVARKQQVLHRLAYSLLRKDRSFVPRSQAIRWVAASKKVSDLEKASRLLDSLQEAGVLLTQQPAQIGFANKRILALCAVSFIAQLPFSQRKRALLRSPVLVSLYAGVQPNMDRLVASWLDDYKAIQQALQKRKRAGGFNPYAPALLQASVAIQSGQVGANVVRQLESILFQLARKQIDPRQRPTVLSRKHLVRALALLSTPTVKAWVLLGLERGKDITLFLQVAKANPLEIYTSAVKSWVHQKLLPPHLRPQKHRKHHPFLVSWIIDPKNSILKRDKNQKKSPIAGQTKAASSGKSKRSHPFHFVWSAPVSKSTAMISLSRKTLTQIQKGLAVLARIGSPQAVHTVLNFAIGKKPSHLYKHHWNALQKAAFFHLVQQGHLGKVFSRTKRLLTQQPHRWHKLLGSLGHAGHPKAAVILGQVLQSSNPGLKKILQRFQKNPVLRKYSGCTEWPWHPKATEECKVARGWLKAQLLSAQTLARSFMAEISLPLLRKIRQVKGRKLLGAQPYLALAFGLIGHSKDFPWVKAVVKEWKAALLSPNASKRWPRWLRVHYAQVLNQAVALFGTHEAFVQLRSMYYHHPWHQLSRPMLPLFQHLRMPSTENFFLRMLLCQHSLQGLAPVQLLGALRTPGARAQLNTLLELLQGEESSYHRSRLCKTKKLPPLQRVRERFGLHDIVWALASIHHPDDLPRFVRWSKHQQQHVRRAALFALRFYSHPAANRAILKAAQRNSFDFDFALRQLQKQRQPIHETTLLKIWNKQLASTIRPTHSDLQIPLSPQKLQEVRLFFKALEKVAGFQALLALWPLQRHSLTPVVHTTFYHLAQGSLHRPSWSHSRLLQKLHRRKRQTTPVVTTSTHSKPESKNQANLSKSKKPRARKTHPAVPSPRRKRTAKQKVVHIRVMTFNILKGGRTYMQPLSRTTRVIQKVRPDIVVLQERGNAVPALAKQLNFHSAVLGRSVAILSRFPIHRKLRYGVELKVATGQIMAVFGVHLKAYPYGPYDLRDSRRLSEASLISTALRTRGPFVRSLLQEMQPYIKSGFPVFLAGDFNEPSHLDWTSKAAKSGRNFGRTVRWPTSRLLTRAGLQDAYRVLFPDELRFPGLTWTPLPGRREVHDRIDLIYHAGKRLRPLQAQMIGAQKQYADVVVQPYPSDHRALLVRYQWTRR